MQMRARCIGFEAIGASDVLATFEKDVTIPSKDYVLVRTEYVGVNMGDVIRRSRGGVPAAVGNPFIPGFEGVGIVVDAPAAHHSLFGQRVAFLVENGAYTTHLAVRADHTFPIPEDLGAAMVASIVCSGLTAWQMVSEVNPKLGETVMVHGAAGGVGHILVQLLRPTQATIIATVSTMEKAKLAEAYGASRVLVHSDTSASGDLITQLRAGEVDIVLDGVGKAVLEANLHAIRDHGKWIVFGSASGVALIPNVEVLKRRLSLRGFLVFDLLADTTRWREGMNSLCESIRTGVLKPRVDVRPATEVKRIHSDLEERRILGRVVMDMSALDAISGARV